MKKGAKVWCFIAFLTVVGLMFSGLIDTSSATSATTEKTTVSVTDSWPWFTKGTNSGRGPWFPHPKEDPDYISTYVGGMSWLGLGDTLEPDCWARFKPYLSQPGEYEVWAYFYACKDTSKKVPFTVKYGVGSRTIKVNQYSSIPAWKEKSLGTWYFEAGPDTYVNVTDATGEGYNPPKGLTIGAIEFVKKETVPAPVITGIDPSQPTARPAKQWISIIGTGFVSDSTVTLRIDSSTHPIPANRTEFKSSTQIRVRAGLTDPGTWTAQVKNPGNRISNLFSFTVKQDIPSPVHDMTVTDVQTSPDSSNVGQLTTIYVTVKNKGDQQEKDVPVKAYVDGYQVGSAQNVTLTDDKSTTKSFTWTPSTAKTYSVKGEVGIVSGETETSDNTKTINVVVSTQPVCIPKLSIPVYTPHQQQAHKGTELRYTINVTNEGTITDTIDLDVAENTQDWDLQLSETSVTLAPGESTYVYLYLTIEEVGARNKITIRGTSQGDSSKISECSGIRAGNLLDGYGLFAAILIFKKDPQERTLSLNVPDYVKISATEIKLDPSAQKTVNVLFDPTPSESDISTIDIDVTVITDTTTGESATIPIKFPEYEIIATNFDMATDSFSFANGEIYGEDTCYGMSVTSILNRGKDTYSLTPREADEKYNILHIQKSWINHVTAWLLHLPWLTSVRANYEILKRNIKKTPLVLCFNNHAVVAYKIVEKGDESYIFIYENERTPYQIASNSFYISLPYATYNLKEHTFNYDGYTKFDVLRADVHVTTIEEAFLTSPIIMLKVYCPVNVTITDQYNRVISDDGTNEIPNATIISTEPKIFYLPAELIYHVTINAYEAGEFTLITVSPVTNTTASVDVFDNISITENTHATLDLAANEVNPMNIDYDGDGTTDEEIYPDENETIEINQPPNAAFTYSPPHPIVNQTITFNASASYDPDGSITNYKWNFGDGNITNTTDSLITHTYVSAGDYTVNLTVTDDEGEYSYTESSITIKESIKEPAFYVPDDYSTIQAAVDAASAGDTIIVRDGTYTENVDIDKSITLKSSSGNPGNTIVQAANPNDHIFEITADYVNISGFTVGGAAVCIFLNEVNYCNISNNHILNYTGIYLNYSNDNIIMNNNFSKSDDGILLGSSNSNTVFNNTFSGYSLYSLGIGLKNSTNNLISDNTICNCPHGGIELGFASSNNIILNNIFKSCGLCVWRYEKNTVEGNTVNDKPLIYLENVSQIVVDNAGQVILANCELIKVIGCNLSNASIGIDLLNSSNCVIENNICRDNFCGGIDLFDYSSNNIVLNNIIGNNFWGIFLTSYASNNKIVNNICENNYFGIHLSDTNNNRIYLNNLNNDCNVQSYDSCNIWNSKEKITYSYDGKSHTKYLGNYWSDYTGTDANKNGIGDSPYSIDDRGGDIDQDYYPLMTWSEHYFNPPPHPLPMPPPTSTLTPSPRPTLTLVPRPTPTLVPRPTPTLVPRPTLRPTATLFEKIEGLIAAIRVGSGI